MKSKNLFVFFIGVGIIFSACEKLDLKRDNPLDQYNNDNSNNSQGGNSVDGVDIHYDSYKVRSDGNGDGIINKGESVQIDVALKNSGTSNAQSVSAMFSTTSEYVSGFSPTTAVAYGDIPSGSAKWSQGYNSSNYTAFKFTVSEDAPSGTAIPIRIEIEDKNGNHWVDSLTLKVESTGARIRYGEHKVRSDGNGDGIINKGESVQIDVALKNSGTSNAQSVKAVFSTTSEYVSGFSPTTAVDYGDIPTGSAKWSRGYSSSNYTAFKFTVSEDAPSGTTIPIRIEIEDKYGNKWESEFVLNVQ